MGDNSDFANLLAAGVQQQIDYSQDPGYGVSLSSADPMTDPSGMSVGGYMPASYPTAGDGGMTTVGNGHGLFGALSGIGSGMGQLGKAILPGIAAAGQIAAAAQKRKYEEQQLALNRQAELIRAAIGHQAPAPHSGFAETPAVKVGGSVAQNDPMARYVSLIQGLK